MIYLSYILANLAILRRAPARASRSNIGAFSLGRWGTLVNILALVWGGAMLINFAWHRVATNPKASETAGLLDSRRLPRQHPDPVAGARLRADPGRARLRHPAAIRAEHPVAGAREAGGSRSAGPVGG